MVLIAFVNSNFAIIKLLLQIFKVLLFFCDALLWFVEVAICFLNCYAIVTEF